MSRIKITLLTVISLTVLFFCSCIHNPDSDLSGLTGYSSSSKPDVSAADSGGTSVAEWHGVSSLNQSSLPASCVDAHSSKPYVSEMETSIPESAVSFVSNLLPASQAESSGRSNAAKLIFNMYKTAFDKTSAMKSYSIKTGEQYRCPSAGLDETILLENNYDAKSNCFSYSFYNRLYGKTSVLQAYGDEKGRVYINDDGNVFVGDRRTITIDLPMLCAFEQEDIAHARIGFLPNRTVLYFTIESKAYFDQLIDLWGPVAGKGLNDFETAVESVDITAVIDYDGYLVSRTCKIEITAKDADVTMETHTFSAQQCIEYAPPSKVRPPVIFDFVHELKDRMKQVWEVSSNV